MQGHLVKIPTKRKPQRKGECTWRLWLSLGRGADGKYKQKCLTFRGTAREAEAWHAERISEIHYGDFVEPRKMTVKEFLTEWLATTSERQKIGRIAEHTCTAYENVVNRHLSPALGHLQLQKLCVRDIERYYRDRREAKTLSETTLTLHHVTLVASLKAAVRKKYVRNNVALDVERDLKPRRLKKKGTPWTAQEAKAFCGYVESNRPTQDAALFRLALDSGARKQELLGLQWKDLKDTTLAIERQLLRTEDDGRKPIFGPPKRNSMRVIHISPQTLLLLQKHKREQSELKMKNRTTYLDHDLVFAHGWEHGSLRLGAPLNACWPNVRLKRYATAAKVKQIKFHDLRHTCATLLFESGESPKVVQERIGHKSVQLTLDVYTHSDVAMQQGAAAKIAALL